MDVVILKEDTTSISFEVSGDKHTLLNALRHELWSLDSVEHASYQIKHPEVGHPIFFLQVKKGKARKILAEALDNLVKKNKELKSLLKKF